MLGETVREHRLKKGLTQARLARLAGVSRRHLAALEKGANVSILVLRKVATVLDLNEIRLTDLSMGSADAERGVNVPLLTDTIREARVEAQRAQAILARAEGLLTGSETPAPVIEMKFPPMPVRYLQTAADGSPEIRDEDRPLREVTTAGELRQGEAVDETKKETVSLPEALVDDEEIVFRARGDKLRDHGIEEGDLLVVELRPRGRAANGELVIGRIGQNCYVGRWWEKHGRKALMSDGLSEITVGRTRGALKVVAAINQILRGY